MTDRVAIVTGGAQGFGFEIARGLAAAGAQVVLADLNGDGAAEAAQRLNDQTRRGTHSAVAVNVADEASVEAMFAEVVSRYGGFDLVVSNAGVLKAGSVKELSAEDFAFVTSVNYTGFFLVAKHAARIFEAQNAAAAAALPERPLYTDIIEINSKSGLTGSNKNGAYAGSKFGGIGLVQSFAMELVADNVKVNAICPGNFFDGPPLERSRPGSFRAVPAGRQSARRGDDRRRASLIRGARSDETRRLRRRRGEGDSLRCRAGL
jgi:sorbitol-6-phosphate 2-dehydrogenase